MAILTWRNVDAPGGLAASAEVASRAGSGINEALSGLASGLGQFRQAQQDQADSAALQAAGRITNSADYERALASGSMLTDAGINPNQVSSKVSQLLSSRQNDLAVTDFNNAQVENQRADNDMALKRFKAEQDQAAIDNQRSEYRFGREQAADLRADEQLANNKAAQELMFSIKQAGLDEGQARERVMSSNQPDAVKNAVLGSLGLGGDIIKLSSAPATAGRPRTGLDAYFSSTSNNPYILSDRPLSQGTFREAYDFGQRLRNETAGKIGQGDKGTSAIGAFQITGETFNDFAEAALGKDWGNLQFNYENQAKVAEAIFNARKKGNLKDTWASLPDSTPGAYKDMSFEEFQRIVLPLESGATLDEVRAQDAQARIGQAKASSQLVVDELNQAANQRLGNIQLDKFQKDLQNDNPDLFTAAAKAIKEYPALQGTDLETVAGWLDVIQQKASATKTKMSPSAATHVLAAALRPDRGFWDFNISSDAATGAKFDSKLVDQTLRAINSGDVTGRGVVARDTASDRDKLNASLKALDAAEKDQERIRLLDAGNKPVSAKVRSDAAAALTEALKRVENTNAAINAKQRPTLIPNAATQEELDRIQREAYFTGIPPLAGSASPVVGGAPITGTRPVGNGVSAAQALQDAILKRPPVKQ